MVSQKLIDWVKKAEAGGYTDKQLVDYLMKKGFKRKDIDDAFGFIKDKDATAGFDFWDKFRYLITNPKLFFDKVKVEKGIKNALLTFIVVALCVILLQFGAYFTFQFFLPRSFSYFSYFALAFLSLFGPIFLVIGFIITVAISFAYAGIVHLIVMAFKGQGSYAETYKVYAYSMIPALILILIPIVGFFGWIYSLVLMIIGVSKLQNIPMGKSAIAVLTPVLLLIGLFGIFIIYLLSVFSGIIF